MRQVLTLKAFIANARPLLRRLDLLPGYASDSDVLEVVMQVVEWDHYEVNEKGYAALLDQLKKDGPAYRNHALEEAAEYQSIYG